MNKRFLIIGAAVIIFIALLAWLYMESVKPLPGEVALQDSREHLPEGTKIDYKFNPPTSGDHYAFWITKGVYDEPRVDGNLVHSQEHGYIIVWYDCDAKPSQGLIKSAYAQEATQSSIQTSDDQGRAAMTGGSEGSPSAKLAEMPKSFSDGSCNDLKNGLKVVYEKFGPKKLIVMPRPNMGTRIVLTAWGRMEKLSTIDEIRIKKFIDAFRDKGPEFTVEP